MAIQILQDVAIHGGIQFLDAKESFPENPSIGTMVLKGTAIYAYIAIGGMETWYPFANRTNSYVHVQGLPNTTWTINHQLHTTDVWIQVKDSNGRIVNATVTTTNEDTVTINFTTAITGTAVIVAPDSINVPEIKASLISVGPNVTINTSGVLINGSYALTSANIDQQIADAVSVETTARQSADDSLQSAISAESSSRISSDATISLNLTNEISRAISVEGDLNNLTTTAKNNLVSAINEIKSGLPVGTQVRFAGTINNLTNFLSLPDRLTGALYYISANGSLPVFDNNGTMVQNKEFKAGDCLLVIKPFTTGNSNIDTNPAVVRIDNTVSAKLSTSRNISISGDATWSVAFDGSSDVTSALTLGNSGVTAGTYNNSATSVTPFTVDSKGRVTGVGSSVNITPSFSSITDKPTTVSGYGITDALSASSNSLPVAQGSVSSATLTTTTTTANQVVDSNLISNVRTVKYLVQVTSNNAYQSSEILVIHDGSNVYMNEFGSITTSSTLANFNADISATELRLLVTPVNANTTIKVIKTVVNV